MNVKLSDYRVHFPRVKYALETTQDTLVNCLALYAACSGCPAIVVYSYAIEILGPSQQLENKIAFLKEWYEYDSVISD